MITRTKSSTDSQIWMCGSIMVKRGSEVDVVVMVMVEN